MLHVTTGPKTHRADNRAELVERGRSGGKRPRILFASFPPLSSSARSRVELFPARVRAGPHEEGTDKAHIPSRSSLLDRSIPLDLLAKTLKGLEAFSCRP